MIDFNCDVAQSFGVYKGFDEVELLKEVTTINIAAGFHAGDAMQIKKALEFARDNDVAISAHIGFPDIQGFGKRKMDIDDEELDAIVTYQISAIIAYAKTFDLEIENVRCHGALKELLNENPQKAKVIAQSIKKINPWLNLFVQNEQTKTIVNELGVKTALEADYDPNKTFDDILEDGIETIHFRKLEDVIEAKKIINDIAPINYNRVQGQI